MNKKEAMEMNERQNKVAAQIAEKLLEKGLLKEEDHFEAEQLISSCFAWGDTDVAGVVGSFEYIPAGKEEQAKSVIDEALEKEAETIIFRYSVQKKEDFGKFVELTFHEDRNGAEVATRSWVRGEVNRTADIINRTNQATETTYWNKDGFIDFVDYKS
jgi:hypothetical protein